MYYKNKEDFSFIISEENEIITNNEPCALSRCRKIKAYISGVIYSHNDSQLLEGFLSRGLEFVRFIEGSFIIFLIIDNQFYIITDKINSLKGYYAYINNRWYVSNNIDALPRDQCKINTKGLACYLAHGVMFNNLTLFSEINIANRASIHSIVDGNLKIEKYWDYKFDYLTEQIDSEDRYQQELESRLIKSIERRYDCSEFPIVSLSAGFDSRGILGIMREKIGANNIECFSYGCPDQLTSFSDPVLSNKLAELCEYPHKIIDSCQGNLLDHLIANAKEGKCIANYCDELDVWHNMAISNQALDVFVGDHCLGSHGTNLDRFIKRRDASRISNLKSFVSKKIFNTLSEELLALFDEILETVSKFDNIQDKLDYLDLDQEINHIYTPWREHFSGQVGFVHSPLLDGAILEFMKILPPRFRKEKKLFRKTLRGMFPELFDVPLAKTSGHRIDRKTEFIAHTEELIDLIRSTDSRLDELIEKQAIINILNAVVTEPNQTKQITFRVSNNFYKSRLLRKARKIFCNTESKLNNNCVSLEQLLTRLLMIRIYLSNDSWYNG